MIAVMQFIHGRIVTRFNLENGISKLLEVIESDGDRSVFISI